MSTYGTWRMSAATYADLAGCVAITVGNCDWIAPQDWMCEPFVVAKTGLTVAEHQARTVANYGELRTRLRGVIPVLQGYTLADYLTCVELYDKAGIDLRVLPLVGLGSVCRRQATEEIGVIVGELAGMGIKLHGFGCKQGALKRYGHLLASADSMAWCIGGRYDGPCPPPSRCTNHMHYALEWRERTLAGLRGAA